MKNFIFDINPFNMGKAQYWTPRSVLTRVGMSLAINGALYAASVYIRNQRDEGIANLIGEPTTLSEIGRFN